MVTVFPRSIEPLCDTCVQITVDDIWNVEDNRHLGSVMMKLRATSMCRSSEVKQYLSWLVQPYLGQGHPKALSGAGLSRG